LLSLIRLRSLPNLRFRFVNRIVAGIARGAIRSVSHPDLARIALMLAQLSNRKKPSVKHRGSFRPEFLVQHFRKPDAPALIQMLT
jgi:hypothetical protein